MNENASRSLAQRCLGFGLAVALIALFIWTAMPQFISRGRTKTSVIINNLRQLEGAKQTWALFNNQTGAVQIKMEDIAPYLHASFKPVAEERYTLKLLTESPEAELTRKLDGRPKGTVIRLKTNGYPIEFISPTN